MSNEIMSNSAVMETENGNQIRRIPIRSNSNLVSSGFAVRTPLWAGLGTCVDNAPTIEDAISMAGLNWIAEERPLYHRANEVFDVDKNDFDYQYEEVKTHKLIVRSDTNSILGVVGKTYTPVQNSEAFSFFDNLIENKSVSLETAGSCFNGKKIWVLAKINNSTKEVIKEDALNSYLLFSNSHDGSMGVRILFTPIRVVCYNTLKLALSEATGNEVMKRALKIYHTKNVLNVIEASKEVINVVNQTFDGSIDVFKRMASTKMIETEFETYVDKVLGIVQKEPTNDEEAEEKVRKNHRKELVKQCYETGYGSDINGVKGTLWGAYNAITEYVDYYRGKEGDNRLSGSWFGTGAAMKVKAYVEAENILRAA